MTAGSCGRCLIWRQLRAKKAITKPPPACMLRRWKSCLKLQDYHGLHGLLSNGGALAARRGDPRRAVTLYGASEALRRRIGAGLAPNDVEDLEELLAEVREAVKEADYAAAWAKGEAMTTEQAVAYAREK